MPDKRSQDSAEEPALARWQVELVAVAGRLDLARRTQRAIRRNRRRAVRDVLALIAPGSDAGD